MKNPGVKLAPAGITVRELIDEYCGGMAEGHAFKGYLPGGASGGILPAAMADIPLDFGTLEPHGCFIGSAAVVVLSDQDDMREVALNLMRVLRGRELRPVHAVPGRHREGGQADGTAAWDETLLDELTQGHARRLDLRARPGGDEPAEAWC